MRCPQRPRYTIEFKSEDPQWPIYVSSDDSDDKIMSPQPDKKFIYTKVQQHNRLRTG